MEYMFTYFDVFSLGMMWHILLDVLDYVLKACLHTQK